MVFILSRVIILFVWIIKWVVIKTRLIFPTLFVVVILCFFRDWYTANELLTYVLFAVVIIGVTVSWVVTLTNKIRADKRWHKRDIAYAYRMTGEPMIAIKRVND